MAAVSKSATATAGSTNKDVVKLPMPATTYFISSALKKLRVKSMNDVNFEKCELWRGMKNLTTNLDFIKTGGRAFPPAQHLVAMHSSTLPLVIHACPFESTLVISPWMHVWTHTKGPGARELASFDSIH